MLGELYSAHSNQFIPGFYLWTPEEIQNTKHIVWQPASSLSFGTDLSRDDKHKMLNVEASLSGGFAGGLISVSGSAKYLTDNKVKLKNRI